MPQAPDLNELLKNRLAAPEGNPSLAVRALKESNRKVKPAKQARLSDPINAAPAAPSFQEKVRESRAKLAGKEHRFFPQNEKPEVRKQEQAVPSRKPAQAVSRKPAQAPADRAEGPSSPMSGKTGEHGRMEGPRTAQSQRNETGEENVEMRPVKSSPAEQVESMDRETGRCEMNGGDELKTRLEEAGISATEGQLRDPAFLANLLQMLQNLSQAVVATEASPARFPVPGGEADLTVAPVGEEVPAVPAPGAEADLSAGATLPAQSEAKSAPETTAAPKSATVAVAAEAMPLETEAPIALLDPRDQEELAGLIMDKLAEIEKGGRETRGETNGMTEAGAVLRNDVSGKVPNPEMAAQTRQAGQGARPVTSEPAGSDADRLRVLQIPGYLEAKELPGAAKTDGPDIDMSEDGQAGDLGEFAAWNSLETESESGQGERDGGQAEFFRKNPEGSAKTETALGKEGISAQAKDVSAIPQFHQGIDQVRGLDRNAPMQRTVVSQHTPVDQAVMAQIVKKMSTLGQNGPGEISIQLEPGHLGKMRIALEMRDGAMNARIGVENENVRQLVDANLASLRETLENQGIKLQGLEVSIDQRHASLFNPDGSNAETFFNRQGRGNQSGPDGFENESLEANPETDTGRRLGYNTLEFIG